MRGYAGAACPECANFTLVRNGSCLKCETCGTTGTNYEFNTLEGRDICSCILHDRSISDSCFRQLNIDPGAFSEELSFKYILIH